MLCHPPLVDKCPVLAGIGEGDLPIVAVQGKQAADVDTKPLDDIVIRQGQPLHDVAETRFDRRQSEVVAQAAIGDDVDAGDLCAAQVEANPIRFPVTERRE